jgi:uncharacterized protein (UPF0548 family)
MRRYFNTPVGGKPRHVHGVIRVVDVLPQLVISMHSDSVILGSTSENSMLLFSKPGRDAIRSFIESHKDEPFSYAEVGASEGRAPDGYAVDHNRVQLGQGAEAYERAVDAIKRWQMFAMPWVELCWPDTPIEAGATVAVLVRHLGFWSLNGCRVVYLVEQHGAAERFGFAYGTLREHHERGEERFTVEFHSHDKSVWYDVYAFSRPKLLAHAAYPYTRRLQRRFARDSMAAMKTPVMRAVGH